MVQTAMHERTVRVAECAVLGAVPCVVGLAGWARRAHAQLNMIMLTRTADAAPRARGGRVRV